MAATLYEVGRAGTICPILKKFQIIKNVQCDSGKFLGFMFDLLSEFLKYVWKPSCDRCSSKMATIYYSVSVGDPAPHIQM